MSTSAQLDALETAGLVLYRNDRYGNTYAIDAPELDRITGQGGIVVIHLGQIAGIEALTSRYAADWLLVRLGCSRRSSVHRSLHRGDLDTDARLAAWDDTLLDVAAHPDLIWDLDLNTDEMTPEECAAAILTAVSAV